MTAMFAMRALAFAALAAISLCGPAWSADEPPDALDLQIDEKPSQGAESAPAEKGATGKLSIEFAAGVVRDRYRQDTVGSHRMSLDFRKSWAIAPGWRFNLSDRLDLQRRLNPGDREAINSLREAHVSWLQPGSDPWGIDVGRLQWRFGPAFGFNPTDVFRGGSLRAFTTADPVGLRENRLGALMVRAQKLWSDGAASIAFAPRVNGGEASDAGLSLDLGSTNPADRVVANWNQRINERLSTQVIWKAERGASPLWGASSTLLVGDAVVAFAEWAGQRSTDQPGSALGVQGERRWRNQVATGATMTLPGQWAVTLEYDFNGRVSDRAATTALVAGDPARMATYAQAAAQAQDSASRHAWMVYATKKALFTSSLDLTALARSNRDDGSWFTWVELRQHWRTADLALQWQRAQGPLLSEYGVLPARTTVQLLGVWYF
jgi:hypothetical protein